jgi:hypothetical protein
MQGGNDARAELERCITGGRLHRHLPDSGDACRGRGARRACERHPDICLGKFGWQSNAEDWDDPPPGTGHGPIKNDPAYPFLNNAEGNRAGTGATKRITNTKDPVLKPWAAASAQGWLGA